MDLFNRQFFPGNNLYGDTILRQKDPDQIHTHFFSKSSERVFQEIVTREKERERGKGQATSVE